VFRKKGRNLFENGRIKLCVNFRIWPYTVKKIVEIYSVLSALVLFPNWSKFGPWLVFCAPIRAKFGMLGKIAANFVEISAKNGGQK
jgi:hypothetical protein